MAEFAKVTIHLPVEFHGEDPDGDQDKIEQVAGAVNELVAEYLTSTIGLDIAATGEATVTAGWEVA